MLWFLAAALCTAVALAYFLLEWVQDALLEIAEDRLFWIVPGLFAVLALYAVGRGVADLSQGATHAAPEALPASMADSKTTTKAQPPSSGGQTASVGKQLSSPTDAALPAVLAAAASTEPERRARLGIVVIHAPESGAPTSAALEAAIQSELERAFRTAGIGLLANKSQRESLIAELRRYQEGHKLYDPATLTQVRPGHFRAASHGVFWSLAERDGVARVECRLVKLLTGDLVATAGAHLEKRTDLRALAGAAAALLTEIVEAMIVSPAADSRCGRVITVHGRVDFLPRDWTLWVSLLPESGSVHYPQTPVTVQRDGEFVSPAVHLGDASTVEQTFRIFIVVVDSEYSTRIREYIHAGSNTGLNLESWPSQHRRLIVNVRVRRVTDNSGTCSGE